MLDQDRDRCRGDRTDDAAGFVTLSSAVPVVARDLRFLFSASDAPAHPAISWSLLDRRAASDGHRRDELGIEPICTSS
jgi:hypothetical protein